MPAQPLKSLSTASCSEAATRRCSRQQMTQACAQVEVVLKIAGAPSGNRPNDPKRKQNATSVQRRRLPAAAAQPRSRRRSIWPSAAAGVGRVAALRSRSSMMTQHMKHAASPAPDACCSGLSDAEHWDRSSDGGRRSSIVVGPCSWVGGGLPKHRAMLCARCVRTTFGARPRRIPPTTQPRRQSACSPEPQRPPPRCQMDSSPFNS